MEGPDIMILAEQIGDETGYHDPGTATQYCLVCLLVGPERSRRPKYADARKREHKEQGNKSAHDHGLSSRFSPYFTYHVCNKKSQAIGHDTGWNHQRPNGNDLACQDSGQHQATGIYASK